MHPVRERLVWISEPLALLPHVITDNWYTYQSHDNEIIAEKIKLQVPKFSVSFRLKMTAESALYCHS